MKQFDLILLVCSWAAVGLACLISAYSRKISDVAAFVYYMTKLRIMIVYYDLLWKIVKFRITHRHHLRTDYFRKTRRPEPENYFDQPFGI